MFAPIEDARLSQGDIINNVVFAYVPELRNPVLYLPDQDESVERDLTQPFGPDEALTVMCEAHKSSVLVLAPSCNIDNDEFICVARIFPLSREIDAAYYRAGSAKKKANHLRNSYQHTGANPAVYYLQEKADIEFPKSIASFLEVHTILKTQENLEYLIANRILRLTEEAIGDLQYRIGFFFGRYAVKTDNYMLTQAERDSLRPAEEEAAQAAVAAEPLQPQE